MEDKRTELQLSGKRKDVAVTRKRREEVENLMLHGTFKPVEAAERHGVHLNTIYRDVERIEKDRGIYRKRPSKKKIAQKQAELQFVMAEAIEQWERSKQEQTERITTITPITCPQCQARQAKIEDCFVCDGSGQIESKKIVTKKIRSTGNPAYLSSFLAALQTAAKLDGLYPSKKKLLKHEYSGSVKLSTSSTLSLENATPEAILDVLEAVERLKQGTLKAIDVDSKPGTPSV